MPVCCIPTKVQFNNASVTTIAYSQAMRDAYGVQPKVYVWYFDPLTGEFYNSGFFAPVKFDGTTITVDHGGPNSGIITVT